MHAPKCSVKHMFMLLVERLDYDRTQMQERVDSSIKLVLNRISEKTVYVGRTRDIGGFKESQSVKFERTDGGVSIEKVSATGERTTFFKVTPALSPDDGRCRFSIIDGGQGSALELWQVSHKALEGLFFERWRD